MADLKFSKAVMSGLKLYGWSEVRISKLTGLSMSAVKAVLASKRRLTDAQLALIEDASGKSVGQLAALTLPDGSKSLAGIFDEIAKVRFASARKPQAVRRR